MCYNIKRAKSIQKGRCFIMTRKTSAIYKILTAVALFTGILLNLLKTSSAISLLSYYTSQSNIICFIAFVCFFVMEIRDKDGKYKNSDVYYLVKGALIIMIFITTFCYHIALAPFGFNMESLRRDLLIKKIANFFLHTCSPVMVILDYFLFDKKGNFRFYYSFIWILFPLNYVGYVYFYAAHGGRFFGIGGSEKYAYFFLDYVELGVWGVAKWLAIILLGILLVSYTLVVIDKKLGKKKKG